MHRRKLAAGSAVIPALAPLLALAQGSLLDDSSLEAVTASMRGDSVPAISAGQSTEPVTGASDDRLPSAVIVSDSQAQFASSFEVRLAEESQSGVTVGNLVNVSMADLAGGINILDQRSASGPSAESPSTFSQENLLTQSAVDNGRLDYFGRIGPSFSLVTRENRESTEFENLSRHIQFTDRQVVLTSRTTTFSATANAERPDLLDGLSIGNQEIPLPGFQIGPPPFTIKIETPGPLVDAFEVTITPPTLNVTTASVTTGGISFEGDQLVFTAPMLNLPDLTFQVCLLLAGCNSDQFSTLTVNGGSFALGPGASVDNPVSAYGVGVGYAIAGSGGVETTDGNVHIGGSIPVDIGAIANLALTVTVPVFGNVGINLDSLNLPVFQIPVDINIPLELPDALEITVENEACVFSNGVRECNPLDVTTTEFESSDEGYSETSSSEQIQTAEYSHQSQLMQDAEVVLEGAEATLIVVDNSSGHATRYSVVVVDDNSQVDVRVLNLVNAAMGIIGNGLNVTKSRPMEQTNMVQSTFRQVYLITHIGGQ